MMASRKDLIKYIEGLLINIRYYNPNEHESVEDYIEHILIDDGFTTAKEVINHNDSCEIKIVLVNVGDSVTITKRSKYKIINLKNKHIGDEYHVKFHGFEAKGVIPFA